jgi:hypothetical protein
MEITGLAGAKCIAARHTRARCDGNSIGGVSDTRQVHPARAREARPGILKTLSLCKGKNSAISERCGG